MFSRILSAIKSRPESDMISQLSSTIQLTPLLARLMAACIKMMHEEGIATGFDNCNAYHIKLYRNDVNVDSADAFLNYVRY